jgi:phosphate transport system substrate-binding protein
MNKPLNLIFSGLTVFSLLTCVISCSHDTPDQTEQNDDTPTSGIVRISVDESYKLIFENQIYTFCQLYPNAKVNVSYKSENQALEDLLEDSSKVAVLNRELTETEKRAFSGRNIFPKTTKIAKDALAIIIHPENIDSCISLETLKGFISGETALWPSSKNTPVVVFDNQGSANARFMSELAGIKAPGKGCFAANGNLEVIDYVSKNRDAIGIIGVSWVSDKDDTLSQTILKKIKVAGIQTEAGCYKPYQAYVATGEYALTRDVFMINRQTRAGLGTGFVSFVAGEKGQRMIKLQGMIPSNMPVRIIRIK